MSVHTLHAPWHKVSHGIVKFPDSTAQYRETLVVYVFHEWNKRVRFFFENGLYRSKHVRYLVVMNVRNWQPSNGTPSHLHKQCAAAAWNKGAPNDWTFKPATARDSMVIVSPQNDYEVLMHLRDDRPDVAVLFRDNIAQDIGAYGAALRFWARCQGLYESWFDPPISAQPAHDAGVWGTTDSHACVMFVNSSTMGPFLHTSDLHHPNHPQRQDQHWSDRYTHKLNNKVGIVGSHINISAHMEHVQSFCFALDARAIQCGIRRGKLMRADDGRITKLELIINHEIGLSRALLADKINMDCLISCVQNVNWLSPRPKVATEYQRRCPGDFTVVDGEYMGLYCGPYETVFVKNNLPLAYSRRAVDSYCQWTDAIKSGAVDQNWVRSSTSPKEIYLRIVAERNPRMAVHYMYRGMPNNTGLRLTEAICNAALDDLDSDTTAEAAAVRWLCEKYPHAYDSAKAHARRRSGSEPKKHTAAAITGAVALILVAALLLALLLML